MDARLKQDELLFQSTHPVWGGTKILGDDSIIEAFQSTHPVWGGTTQSGGLQIKGDVSIHPPRVGWDFVLP